MLLKLTLPIAGFFCSMPCGWSASPTSAGTAQPAAQAKSANVPAYSKDGDCCSLALSRVGVSDSGVDMSISPKRRPPATPCSTMCL